MRKIIVSEFVSLDGVIEDPDTGKPTLVGVFEKMAATVFPAEQPEFGIYFQLTGLNGSYRFEIEILGEDLQTVLGRLAFPDVFEFEDPLLRVSTWISVDGVTWPGPGRYSVRLLYNGRIAEDTPLIVERNP